MLSRFIEDLHVTGQTIIAVRVRPGSAKTMLRGVMADGTMKIDVAAVPEHGFANAELIRFLAQEFGIPKECVEMVFGKTTRKKVIRITHR